VLLLAAAMVAVPYFLGQRHRAHATDEPYESGMLPTSSARLRLTADYYLIALLFVIFDLEAVFLYAWAVSARQGGWAALGGAAVFVGVLLAGLGYLWGVGALEWGPAGRTTNGER